MFALLGQCDFHRLPSGAGVGEEERERLHGGAERSTASAAHPAIGTQQALLRLWLRAVALPSPSAGCAESSARLPTAEGRVLLHAVLLSVVLAGGEMQ